MTTPTPELARVPKAGLQHRLGRGSEAGRGTPAPGAGYALTLTQRALAPLKFAHDHDRSDVATGVALVAVKRASLVGRGPTLEDVLVALELFNLRGAAILDRSLTRPFAGLAHSYVAQRRFVDSVRSEQLLDAPRVGVVKFS